MYSTTGNQEFRKDFGPCRNAPNSCGPIGIPGPGLLQILHTKSWRLDWKNNRNQACNRWYGTSLDIMRASFRLPWYRSGHHTALSIVLRGLRRPLNWVPLYILPRALEFFAVTFHWMKCDNWGGIYIYVYIYINLYTYIYRGWICLGRLFLYSRNSNFISSQDIRRAALCQLWICRPQFCWQDCEQNQKLKIARIIKSENSFSKVSPNRKKPSRVKQMKEKIRR